MRLRSFVVSLASAFCPWIIYEENLRRPRRNLRSLLAYSGPRTISAEHLTIPWLSGKAISVSVMLSRREKAGTACFLIMTPDAVPHTRVCNCGWIPRSRSTNLLFSWEEKVTPRGVVFFVSRGRQEVCVLHTVNYGHGIAWQFLSYDW